MFIKKAFTLIELLVVIVIIGVLATLAVVALSSARAKARDARRVSDLKQISTALELYLADESTYPTYITPGQPMVGLTSGKTYMSKVPSNPGGSSNTQANNQYSYFSNGSKYTLRTYTENAVSDLPAGGKIVASSGGVKNAENTDNRYWDADLTFGGTLVGYWPLNGDVGSADLSGNNNTGALVGGVATSTGRFGEALGAYSFDGLDDRVNVGLGAVNVNESSFTISAWMLAAGNSTQNSWTGVVLGSAYTNGGFVAPSRFCGTANCAAFTGGEVNNVWIHRVATMTYSATSPAPPNVIKTYVNGVYKATTNVSVSLATHLPNMYFGVRDAGGSNFFAGQIADVRLYSKALEADEVLTLYNATKP